MKSENLNSGYFVFTLSIRKHLLHNSVHLFSLLLTTNQKNAKLAPVTIPCMTPYGDRQKIVKSCCVYLKMFYNKFIVYRR